MYVDDWRVPGMLWCKGLRSPHESARIVHVDTSKAEKLPGVHGVALHGDMPTNIVGHLAALGVPADEPYLAIDEVRYRGQLIGGVAAEDEDTAQEAVSLIHVEYEEREPFLDIRKAFEQGGPQLTPEGNVFFYDPYYSRRVRKGDIDWAFEHADVIVQGAYRPAAIEQMPTEPQVALVHPQPDGRIVVYSCTQAMYFSMGVLAQHLNLPTNRFKFVGGTVGGGFGGKVDTATEPLAAILALKTSRAVKWRFTREEEFLCGSTRASWHVEMADAVTEDGWLLGRKVLTLHDAGAYTRFSSYGATKHSFHLGGAYTVPHMHTDAYVVWTNHVPTHRHARLRRDVGLVRDRDADVARGGRARPRSVGVPPQEREPHRRPRALPRDPRRPVDGADDPGGRRGGRQGALRRVPDDDQRRARGRLPARAPRRPDGDGQPGQPLEVR